MSEPEKVYEIAAKGSNQLDPEFCKFGTCPYYDKFCDHTLQDKHRCAYLPHTPEADLKYLEQTFAEFAQTQDDLIAEYDVTLKTHGDTLEQHMTYIEGLSEEHLDRIHELESMYESAIEDIYAIKERLCKITDLLVGQCAYAHIFSNFCGNCIHAEIKDGIYACELSGEIVDPDDSSCSMFEPPF